MKRSFTLTPESVAFVAEMRKKRRANSDSEALDLLLRELMLDAKRRQLEAATKAYYDTASDEELAGQREWAERSGPNIFVDMDSAEAQS